MGTAKQRGVAGESLAAAYLELMGFTIEARNVRLAGIEVDLVALEHAVRVLVEVKLRSRPDYGGPALAVDPAKRVRLRRAALTLDRESAGGVRVDVVAIDLDSDGLRLRHYRNAVTD